MPFACRKRLKSTPQPVLLGPDSTTAKVELPFAYGRDILYHKGIPVTQEGVSMYTKRMHIEWQEDEEALLRLYKEEQDLELRPRWHALWLLRKGYSVAEVVMVLSIHERTLRRWIAWYRAGGVEEVRRHRKGGRQGRECWLTPKQKEKLKARAAEGGFRTIHDAVKWTEENFKVKYTYWGMRSLFVRLGIKKKVPRPKAVKASPEAQEEWKKGVLLQPFGIMA